jgi:hypothetical protein
MMYIITLILIALASGIVGFYAKRMIARIKQYYTEIKHKRNDKLRNIIREEIRNILIELKNN